MAAGTTAAELRELTDEELVLRLRESKEELFNLRFQMATGQLDNNRRLRTVRHEIARIYTRLQVRGPHEHRCVEPRYPKRPGRALWPAGPGIGAAGRLAG